MNILGQAQQHQDECADCGNPNPSWASLNCCVLLCNDCSSVHRSLGRHVSQVKSLTHHRWRDTQLQMVRQVVAGGSNKFWEYSVLEKQRGKDSVKKPRPNDPIHPAKADFIKRKYEQQAFCKRYTAKEAGAEASDASQQLHASVRTPNVETSFRLLARGADPNFLHPEKGSSALHVAAQERQPLQAELLLVFGADPELRDSAGRTAQELAELPELAQLLAEARFELSDRFADFLCGRVPDHRAADSPGGHFLLPPKSGSVGDGVGGIDGGDARMRLAALPASAFQELLRDAYDELDRRDSNRVLRERLGAETAASLELLFLPLNPHYSATRNQGRQKLGRLSAREFGVLLGDALEEAARRSGVAPDLCARPAIGAPSSSEKIGVQPVTAHVSSQSSRSPAVTTASAGGLSRSLDNGLSDDPVYDFVPADSEYASINPSRQRQAASCSAASDREESEQPPPPPPPPPPPSLPQAQPVVEAPADPLKAALAALYGAASEAVAESAAAATSESNKSSLCRVSDLSESAVSGPHQAEPRPEVPVSQDDVIRLKASHERLLEENRALRLQVEMLQRQNAELLARVRQSSPPLSSVPPKSSSPQLSPPAEAAPATAAPATAAPASSRLSSSAVPGPTSRASRQPQQLQQQQRPQSAFPSAAGHWEPPPPPPPPPPLYDDASEVAALAASDVGLGNGVGGNDNSPSPPPPPPPPLDEADYDQPPPESDEEAECDRLVREIIGSSLAKREAAAAAAAGAAPPAAAPVRKPQAQPLSHQRAAFQAAAPSTSAPPVMAPRPAPTQEEVVALTEAVTGRIYKLLEAARQGNHECFPECAAAIRNSVLHMATVIPRVRPDQAKAVDALLSAADTLDHECRARASPADLSRRTQRVIQCCFDIAKAAKSLVSLFQ